jgi:hypothetical protein
VWEPDTRLVSEALPLPPSDGSEGRPSLAVSTTVPESPGTRALATSASSCSAVRGGSDGGALSEREADASATPPATTATTASGAMKRSIPRRAERRFMPYLLSRALPGHRLPCPG